MGLLLPTILSVLPFFGAYSPNKYYCWITIPSSEMMSDRHKLIYKSYSEPVALTFIVALYLIAWITIVINLILYIKMICYRSRNITEIRRSIYN